jgi:hypothetical protein
MRLRITFSDGVTRESNIFTKRHFDAHYRVLVQEVDLLVEETGGSVINPALGPIGAALGWVLHCTVAGLGLGLLFFLVVIIVRVDGGRTGFGDSRLLFLLAWLLNLMLLPLGFLYSVVIPLTVVIETVLALVYAAIRRRDAPVLGTAALVGNTLTQYALWITLNALSGGDSIILLLVGEVFVIFMEALIYYVLQRRHLSLGEALGLSFVLNAITFVIGLMLAM